MVSKSGSTHVDLKQFAYRPRVKARKPVSAGGALSGMGQSVHGTAHTRASGAPRPLRLPNIPHVPATGPHGVFIANRY